MENNARRMRLEILLFSIIPIFATVKTRHKEYKVVFMDILSNKLLHAYMYFFVALFVLSLCPFDISVGVGAFVIGLSQISSFFS